MKLSSKYQIVIPRLVRRQAGFQAGETIYARVTANHEVILSKQSPLDRARNRFVGQGAWGPDPAATVAELRHELDEA